LKKKAGLNFVTRKWYRRLDEGIGWRKDFFLEVDILRWENNKQILG